MLYCIILRHHILQGSVTYLSPFCFAATEYVETSMSYSRQRGNLSILESEYLVGAVNCLSFYYYMSGEDVGRLNVYIVGQDEETSLPWRLAGNQGNEWKIAQVAIDAAQGFKVSILVTKR